MGGCDSVVEGLCSEFCGFVFVKCSVPVHLICVAGPLENARMGCHGATCVLFVQITFICLTITGPPTIIHASVFYKRNQVAW